MTSKAPDFDRLARAYRWLEYLTLGPALQRTRIRHLPELLHCTHALILGDGDGRFTQRLLGRAPALVVDAVDISGAMLELLRARTAGYSVHTFREDVRDFKPRKSYDLVTTHFLLDCLTQEEVDCLVTRLAPSLQDEALWLVSEFRVPEGALRWPTHCAIRALYGIFRLLTGLEVTHLPDHAGALQANGFRCLAQRRLLCGILTAELWQKAAGMHSHRTRSGKIVTAL